jgi:predicted DCC family thiol-disulfide oxidoreductase YuxK
MGSPGSIGGPAIILFDGVCNLCNGLVQFIIKRDPHAKFRFASLQSDAGRSLLTKFHLNPDSLHSIILIEDDKAFERSEAAFQIAKHLAPPWKWFRVLRFLPKFLCDLGYNFVAANRYRVFGKRDNCMIPRPALKERFLTNE